MTARKMVHPQLYREPARRRWGTSAVAASAVVGVMYADVNVGRQCDGRHVVKRFFTLPVSALNQWLTHSIRQFVSRRSILPTGNLATLC
ncbi:hypothetical protein [Mycobacterium sp. 050134]|uniref:hypothetical protein n=1 Tax=Mycobacterium sp. 050134 TaxID=3096111 RepID=UPI002EDB589C